MENYWDRTLPPCLHAAPLTFLQTHGCEIRWQNIYIREVAADEANTRLRGDDAADGKWNYQEVTVKESAIKVELNGGVILDADIAEATESMNDREHPGKDFKSGHFGFAGHKDPVMFRNIAIKKL